MKYNEEQLKALVLEALEECGYHDEKWGQQGESQDREDKGYYNGKSQALLTVYGIEGFQESKEARAAYQAGVNKYNNRVE